MKKINYTFLLAEFFILYLGALTGWILARKIVGDKSGFQFLMLALFVSSILFAGKILIYSKAKKSLFYNLIFIGGIAIDLAWLFNCLILPLFWLSNFGLFQKICVLAFYTHICVGNILLALKTFDEKWENAGRRKVEEIFELDQNPVDWGEISRSMRLEAVLFIPGIPLKYGSAISVILVLMAFLGLVLRGVYPLPSMIALGLPFSIAAACCLQISSYSFAQARKVKIIERSENGKIKYSG